MAHWLPLGAGDDLFNPVGAVQVWSVLAARTAKLQPDQRRGFLSPYEIRLAESFGRAVPLVPDEMV